MIRVIDFKVVHFIEQKNSQNVILLYSLGEDGIVREFANGKWMPFPITEGDYHPLPKGEGNDSLSQ